MKFVKAGQDRNTERKIQTNKKGGVQKSCYEDALTKRTAAQGSDYKY